MKRTAPLSPILNSLAVSDSVSLIGSPDYKKLKPDGLPNTPVLTAESSPKPVPESNKVPTVEIITNSAETINEISIASEQKEIYRFENGLRKVEPYHFCYKTFTKERWIGKNIYDVFITEFRNKSKEYYVIHSSFSYSNNQQLISKTENGT